MPQWRIPNSKPMITMNDEQAVALVLRKVMLGEFELGSEVAAFERELAEFLGRKYVVCVSSGTVALELAGRATMLDDCPVHVTHMPAFGFIATPNAATRAGWRLAFTDGTGNCVLGETPAETGHYRDACQAFGAKLPPSLADCYSFNWNKPITCLGGGCVATDDVGLACEVEALRNQGRYPLDRNAGWTGNCTILGTNARMSDMQAALGRSQLRRVGGILEWRTRLAHEYGYGMARLGLDQAINRDSWFLYPIELSNRDEVHAKMQAKGIQTRSCADWLLPAHPYYAEKYGYKRGDFPEAERRADRTLLLPLYPEMTLEQVQEVCKALEEVGAKA